MQPMPATKNVTPNPMEMPGNGTRCHGDGTPM
jgi:hypothetical protein